MAVILPEVCREYLDLLDGNSAAQTFTNNRRTFELYAEFLQRRSLDEKAVQLADLRDWIRELISQYKPSTVSRHAISLRAAYNHAFEIGVVPTNPTSGINKLIPKLVDKLPETMVAEEIRRCHALLGTEREEMIFHLLLWTGCRAAELRPLRWSAGESSYVDFDNDQLVIVGKNHKIRFVPLHPVLRAKLEAWPERGHCVITTRLGEQMSHQTWTTEVTQILHRAEIYTEKKSHLFRKTLNTNLQRQRVPDHVLDALFGWAPATVRTKHYSGIARDEVREGLLKAYQDDPVVPEQESGVVEEALIAKLQAEITRLNELKRERAVLRT